MHDQYGDGRKGWDAVRELEPELVSFKPGGMLLDWRPVTTMPLTIIGGLVDILDRRRLHTGLTVQGISYHGGLVYVYTRIGVLASEDMKWRHHE